MAFQGFGKNSGPSVPPKAQPPFGYFPRPPSPFPSASASPSLSAPPLPLQPSPRPILSPPKWDDGQRPFLKEFDTQAHQRSSQVATFVASRNSGIGLPAKIAQVQDLKRTRSPPLLSSDEDFLRNSRASRERPALSPYVWVNQGKLSGNFANSLAKQEMPSASHGTGPYESGRTFPTKHADVQVPKRARSPPLPSKSEASLEKSLFDQNDSKRPSISPSRLGTTSNGLSSDPDCQSHWRSPPSVHVIDAESVALKPSNFPVPKRTKLPSYDEVFQDNSYSAEDDIERELQAKAKRLARFKDELGQPMQSSSNIGSQKVPLKRQNQSTSERQKFMGEPSADVAEDLSSGHVLADYEGLESSNVIIGLCPDMCPEPERGERERKGDLDQYERLDGDRNLSSKALAVKKYTRTAEREVELIRPMPILQKTIDYLLSLLDQPYDDRFLGLYNFLWDRMRAIRMDLRMQHIFDLGAITMLEQMIRLHIIAMHELCEYTKGEGFSEGFDAHLNIEQMNKTSVELFQLYDDHRKKGIDVPTDKEFRGYYALLKLDKHPGYKVEPAELSLDLAKMTPEIRQTPEILFARDVARACRIGNFIGFFRLARKASYLQACLMHAHFAKLRTQALASLHCGLQNNQGIPVNHVAKWLGMEEEDIESLLEYHGFLVKEFEEPYMVKEGPFLNVDIDYPVKCSKLVHLKKSRRIVGDVSSPCLAELVSSEKVKELQLDRVYEQELAPSRFETESSAGAIEEEMPDYEAVSSPHDDMQVKPMVKTLVANQQGGDDNQSAAASPLPWDFTLVHSSRASQQAKGESAGKPKYDAFFRNSVERITRSDTEGTQLQIMPRRLEQEILPVSRIDSVAENLVTPFVFAKYLEDEEHMGLHREVETDEMAISNYDEEVADAKLKLILRIWRRLSSKKRELREQRQLAASAALSSLSLGPTIWHYKDPPSTFNKFNIDRVMSERHEKLEQSWSRLSVSDVVAPKLSGRNPDAKCLCWKIILCSQESQEGDELGRRSQVAHLTAGQWLLSKLMPARNDGDDDLVVSSPGLSIWKKWVPSQSGDHLTCCLSVIRDAKFDHLDETVAGASAVLFLASDCIPWEVQKIRLHSLLMSLPSGSYLPLLILSGFCKDNSDPCSIVKELGLYDIDKSRMSTFSIAFLVEDQQRKHFNGFFSDDQLREGLQWLASESPSQPVLHHVNMRELVLSSLNSSLEVLDEMNAYKVGPDHCISAFNEALDKSMEKVAAAANANPVCWPSPEIALLEESSDEHGAVALYLPAIGWSSSARIKPFMATLSYFKLPAFPDDISWLYKGSDMGGDIEEQISQLENCLIKYLIQSSQMMGSSLARQEARIMLQKCTRLELHDTTYYLIPKWVTIFRRVFNWQLISLSNGPFSSAYVLEQHSVATQTSGGLENLGLEGSISSPYYLIHPSLDEMLEVGCVPGMHNLEYEYSRPVSMMILNESKIHEAANENDLMKDERNVVQERKSAEVKDDNIIHAVNNTSSELVVATKATKESDRLSKLLEQCNLVQNMIDKKLSIYF